MRANNFFTKYYPKCPKISKERKKVQVARSLCPKTTNYPTSPIPEKNTHSNHICRLFSLLNCRYKLIPNVHTHDLDGTFIEQKISIGSLIYHDFVTFIWEIFSVRTLQTIDGFGIHLSMLCFSWPGMTGFFLAMIYRGLRYRGPDTYPNFSDPVPELPKFNFLFG